MSEAPFCKTLTVHRPAFEVALLRTKHLGPKYAKFSVPLWFSKVDLRDYLYHAYNVRTLGIRSYVKLRPVTEGVPSGIPYKEYALPQRNRHHRPPSLKFMTVELESPFVWPEIPEDLSPWQQEMHLAQQKVEKAEEAMNGSMKDAAVDKANRRAMKEQYEAIMKGTKQWEAPQKKNQGPVLGG